MMSSKATRCSILTLVLFVACFGRATDARVPASKIAGSNNLRSTNALKREIDLAQQSLSSTSARLSRLQSAARNCRKKAEEVGRMVSRIKSIESQISRIEKQLYSFSKVPQLRMLKPVVSALKSVRGKVASVRAKAEKVKRNSIDPTIKKIRSFESEVNKVRQKVQSALLTTNQAEQQIQQLESHLARLRYPRAGVSALEGLAKQALATVRPMRQTLSDVDQASGDAESKLNSFTSSMNSVTKLSSGLDKIQKDLAPIDKKAKDLDKVLSKRFSFKIPFKKKKVSFTVRQILESPGKVLDIALKPLTALAKKALSPLTKKLKFNIKAPKEIEDLSRKLDALQNRVVNLANAQVKLANAARSTAISNYHNAMNKIASMNPSQLGR